MSIYEPLPPPARGRGRGRGRPVAPSVPASLGANVRTIQSTVRGAGPNAREVVINRDVLDIEQDADYDPDNHRPSEAYLNRIARADLTDATFHDDPYEETGRLKMKPAPGEVEAFREYVHAEQFRRNVQVNARLSEVAVNAFERNRMALETTEAGANVRLALRPATGPSVADRLAASTLMPPEAAQREAGLPPPTPEDAADRVHVAETQHLTVDDLRALLSIDFLPNVDTRQRDIFLSMPCANTIVRRLAPLLLVSEQHRQHYNVVELTDFMLAAGCKYHSISRVETTERLATLLDPAHYRGDIEQRGAVRQMRGGHEHYDAQHRSTRLVIVHFYCILRPKQTKEQRQRQMAERLVGLAAQAEKESEENAHFDPDDDIWDDTGAEEDEDYTGGNDLHNPASHYIYRCSVVCVEATDCVCANEALEPAYPPPPAPLAAPATHSSATYPPPAPLAAPRSVTHSSATYPSSHTVERAPVAEPVVLLDDSEAPFDVHPPLAAPAAAPAVAPPPETPEKSDPKVVPDGLGTLSFESAKVLAGKYRAVAFMANAQGVRPLYPLCIRAFQFSVGEGVS